MFQISTFFLIGLTGGFGHCVLMCHPFVLYISTKYIGRSTGMNFFIPHIYYNLGRIITYTFLGALAGFLGSVVQFAGSFVHIQKLAAIVGGSILIIYALLSIFKISIKTTSFFTKYFKNIEPNHPLFSGILLGFLPCGLSMGAIIGSASTGSFVLGGLQLLAFGLGTSVAMMVIAVFGSIALKYIKILSKVSFVLLLFMGIYFIYMGLNY